MEAQRYTRATFVAVTFVVPLMMWMAFNAAIPSRLTLDEYVSKITYLVVFAYIVGYSIGLSLFSSTLLINVRE